MELRMKEPHEKGVAIRFSCMEFPDVHGVYDYAGPSDNSR